MLRHVPIVLVLLAPAFAGCLGAVTTPEEAVPAEVVEPAFDVETTTYDEGIMIVTRATVPTPYPVRVRGTLYEPTGVSDAMPLVILLHGNHGTCGGTVPTYPSAYCGTLPGQEPIPSHAGYAYLAEDLAQRGILVASIDANDVNDGNALDVHAAGRSERGQLVLHTIDVLAARYGDRLDLTRVGLMGHSRGGEGVVEAARVNQERVEPVGISAVVALAPTDFSALDISSTPFLVVLPSCDGDVSNQWGAEVYDRSRDLAGGAPLVQALVMGANHNFYNTVWEWDDGANGDAYCDDKGATRPTAEAQREGGRLLMNGFLMEHLGHEHRAHDLLRGAARLPEAACAPALAACEGALHVSRHDAARLDLMTLRGPGVPKENALGGALSLTGFDEPSVCRKGVSTLTKVLRLQAPVADPSRSPACPTPYVAGDADLLHLAWKAPGATLSLDLPPTDATRHAAVSLRVGVDHATTKSPPLVRVTLVDAAGNSASVLANDASDALFVPPGEVQREIVVNAVRVPLAAFSGVDVGQIVRVAWTIEGPTKGALLATDAMLTP